MNIPSLSRLELGEGFITFILLRRYCFFLGNKFRTTLPGYRAIPFLNISEPRLFERVRTILLSIFSEPRLYSGSTPFLFGIYLSQDFLMSSTIFSSFNPTIISNHDNLRHEVVKIMGLDAFGYDFVAVLYVPILLCFEKIRFSEQPVIP